MNPEPILIEFEKFTYGGESMGHMPDGRTIFCPFVLPQETAFVDPVFEKKRYVRAELVSIDQARPERITPRCKHFGVCGGCHYQHLPYKQQTEVKEVIVRDQLQRIGGIENPPVFSIVKSDEDFYYRNSISFQVNKEGETGFYHYQRPIILPIEECHLPQADILTLWKQMDIEPIPGLKNVHFREGKTGDLMVILESDDIVNLPEMELDLPVSVVHLSPAGPIVLAGDDHLVHEILGRSFKVSAASFFQVNEHQAEKMVKKVLTLLPLEGKTLLELYCGVGLFSAFCAPRFEQVIAIEESESACEDFTANLDDFENISLYVGRVSDVLPGLDQSFDVVLLDPPRSGLDIYSFDALMGLNIPKIIYISCDVATFARDVKKMTALGYHLSEVTPFDMFPQTYHVECVGLLERE